MRYVNKAAGNFFNELELNDIVIIGDKKDTTLVYDNDGIKKHLSKYHHKILCSIFEQEELEYVRTEYDPKTFEVVKSPKKEIFGTAQWHTKQ